MPAWEALRFTAVILLELRPPVSPMLYSSLAVHLKHCSGSCLLFAASARRVQAAKGLLVKRPFRLPVLVPSMAIEAGGPCFCRGGGRWRCQAPNAFRTTAVGLRKRWPSALLHPPSAAFFRFVRGPGASHGPQANSARIDTAALAVLGATHLGLLR